MQREYLRTLGIEDESVLEKILAENGRDVQLEQSKIPTDYEEIKKKLKSFEEKGGPNPNGTDPEDPVQKALAEAEALKKQYQRDSASLKVKEVFVKAGLTEEDYKDLLGTVVTEDEESSISKANNLVGLITNKITATEKRVKEEVLKDTPAPPTGGGTGGENLSDAAQFAEKYSKQFELKE